MKFDVVLFDKLIVRLDKLFYLIAIGVLNGAINLDLLHVSHIWLDRLNLLFIVIMALNNPLLYKGNGPSSQEKLMQ